MLNNNFTAIANHISGQRAYNHIKKITDFHRIQASPGYRAAAEYCLKTMKDEGISSKIISYEATDSSSYWQKHLFQEWHCKDAYLDLVYPHSERLSDFKSNAMSLIQRSAAVDMRNTETDIVCVPCGFNSEQASSLDLRGKILFVSESISKYTEWIADTGIAGIITDKMPEIKGIRSRCDLYDDTPYVSFWWTGKEKKIFGFVLTPREGDKLRQLCNTMESEYQKGQLSRRYPAVKAFVDAEFYDGHIENVVAEIPGSTEEEILITAHLRHPKQCANDNASGVAGAMEVMKTINDLIVAGKLKKPKRTIKMLLIPEMAGTYAYLSTNEDKLSRVKAAINLDMIGGDQSKIFGPLLLCGLPEAGPSFAVDLASVILDKLKRDVKIFFTVDTHVSTFNSNVVKFMYGSDNYILSDPDVGIPCLALAQLPDKMYHTSADTVDKIDPKILYKSSALCACFVYTMAELAVDDVILSLNKSRESYGRLLSQLIKTSMETGVTDDLPFKFEHYKEVYQRSCSDSRRFFAGDELKRINSIIAEEMSYYDMMAETMQDQCSSEPVSSLHTDDDMADDRFDTIPKRLFRGPIAYTNFARYLDDKGIELYRELKAKYAQEPKTEELEVFSMLWCDGKRRLRSIIKHSAVECGAYNPEYVYDYFCFLANVGLMQM